jgi:hypothetical protein
MSIEVRRAEPVPGDEIDEVWERIGLGPDWDQRLRGVDACHWPGEPAYWQVEVWMAEHVREEPLQSEMSTAVWDALMAVEGVTDAFREDTETFVVFGAPSGEQLVRAVAVAVDRLFPQASELVDQWAAEAAEAEQARREERRAAWQEMRRQTPPPREGADAEQARGEARRAVWREMPEQTAPTWRIRVLGPVMSLLSLFILVSGAASRNLADIALGTAGLLFFGGGTAFVLLRERRGQAG